MSAIRSAFKRVVPKSLLEALIYAKFADSRLPNLEQYIRYTHGGEGLEIGGPSMLFKTVLPLYRSIGSLDGVNFAEGTIWEGKISAGMNFKYYGNRVGRQYIAEATELTELKTDQYDFILSSNCLEHIANPIKALSEWARITKPNGALIVVVPNKINNFDHKRPTTRFEHLIEDFENGTPETDLTHLDEILSLHDLKMDPPAGDIESFKRRSLNNHENRALHHHVFDQDLLQSVLAHAGLDVVDLTTNDTDIFSLAIKKS